jgi:hypothetical protein
MYCVYKLESTFNVAQVHADIIGLVTGTITSMSQCSASCNSGGSTLIRTVLPEWTMHDAAAGASSNGAVPVVLKSEWTDSSSNYKYVYLSAIGASALSIQGVVDWNETAHTTTKVMSCETSTTLNTSANKPAAVLLPTSGFLVISASKAHFAIVGYNASLNASYTQQHSFHITSEYTRDDPWNTVAAGYPSWLSMSGNPINLSSANIAHNFFSGNTAKVFNTTTGIDYTGVPWYVTYATNASPSMYINPYTLYETVTHGRTVLGMLSLLQQNAVDQNKAPATFIYPLVLTKGLSAGPMDVGNASTMSGLFLGGNMSAKNNTIYGLKQSRGNTFDEIVMGSDVFTILNLYGSAGSTSTICVKKA